jgi:hypothetical protein
LLLFIMRRATSWMHNCLFCLCSHLLAFRREFVDFYTCGGLSCLSPYLLSGFAINNHWVWWFCRRFSAIFIVECGWFACYFCVRWVGGNSWIWKAVYSPYFLRVYLLVFGEILNTMEVCQIALY